MTALLQRSQKWVLALAVSLLAAAPAFAGAKSCRVSFRPSPEVQAFQTPAGFKTQTALIWTLDSSGERSLNEAKFREVLHLQVEAVTLQLDTAVQLHSPVVDSQLKNALDFFDGAVLRFQNMVSEGSSTEALYRFSTYLAVIGSAVIDAVILQSAIPTITDDLPKANAQGTVKVLANYLDVHGAAALSEEHLEMFFHDANFRQRFSMLVTEFDRQTFTHPSELGVLLYYVASDNRPMDLQTFVEIHMNWVNIGQVNHSPQAGDNPQLFLSPYWFRRHDDQVHYRFKYYHLASNFTEQNRRNNPMARQGSIAFASQVLEASYDIAKSCLNSGLFSHKDIFEMLHEPPWTGFLYLLLTATEKNSFGLWAKGREQLQSSVESFLSAAPFGNQNSLIHRATGGIFSRPLQDRRTQFLRDAILQWRATI